MASSSDAETILADDEWRNNKEHLPTSPNHSKSNGDSGKHSKAEGRQSLEPESSNDMSSESSLSSLDELSEISSDSPQSKAKSKPSFDFSDSDSSLSDLSELDDVSNSEEDGYHQNYKGRINNSRLEDTDDEDELSISSHSRKNRANHRTITDDYDLNSSDDSNHSYSNKVHKFGKNKNDKNKGARKYSFDSSASIINDLKKQNNTLELLPAPTEATGDTSDGGLYQQFRNRRKPGRRRKYDLSNPNQLYKNGTTQLSYFVSRGDTKVCKELLLKGADINLADSRGWTPVHEAAKLGNTDVLKLLLDPPHREKAKKGYDPKADKNILTPFPRINHSTHDDKTTPLHEAVKHNDVEVTTLLLEHGARVDLRNSKGLNALDICSDPKLASILSEQLTKYKNVSNLDRTGQTRLHKACSVGNYDEVVKLIKCGIDINSRDHAKWTPIHEASLKGHDDIVCILIRYGADVNAKGLDDQTSLHDACSNGYHDILKHLIQAGADPYFRNSKGESCEDLAEDDKTVAILRKACSYAKSSKSKTSSKRKQNGSDASKAHARSPKDNRKRNQIVSDSEDYEEDDEENHSKISHRYNSSRSSVSSSNSSSYENLSLSVKKLKEEAEKPKVNYYFSSTSSGLSREERKIQQLMSTFAQMDRSQGQKGRKRSCSSPDTPASPKKLSPSKDVNARHEDEDSRPKRKRGRPPKKLQSPKPNGKDKRPKKSPCPRDSEGKELSNFHSCQMLEKTVKPLENKIKRDDNNSVVGKVQTIDITTGTKKVPFQNDRQEEDLVRANYNTIIAERAMRYLPLYTVQLESDVDPDRLEFFVVDFQVRLLLDMPIDDYLNAKSDAKDVAGGARIKKEVGKEDTDEDKSQNTLFLTYPELKRRRITHAQKERLWSPLTSMFVSNVLLIDKELRPKFLNTKPTGNSNDGGTTDSKPWYSPNCQTLREMTNQEKARFVGLDLFFVQLDQVVEIVKRDYPHLSHNLMTITLDIGYNEFINGEQKRLPGINNSSGSSSVGVGSSSNNRGERKALARNESDTCFNGSNAENSSKQSSSAPPGMLKFECVDNKRPLKMLPLKYAMKIQYNEPPRPTQT